MQDFNNIEALYENTRNPERSQKRDLENKMEKSCSKMQSAMFE